MSHLLVRPSTPDASGRVLRVTPETARWSYVGFEVFHLEPGASLARETGGREVCLVLITGRAKVATATESWPEIGERMSLFDGESPYSVYVPAGDRYQVEALSALELAVCSAPGGGGLPARLIGPEDVSRSTRGSGTNTRHVRDILPQSASADNLLVVEVITPSGCWSSYPPHKHDTDNLPVESSLEETYYHRLNPAQGFAFQRVYTDDRAIDETMTVEDGHVVMVPRGYHPVGAPHGYDLYYLNVMAGPTRAWHFKNDPAHEWIVAKP